MGALLPSGQKITPLRGLILGTCSLGPLPVPYTGISERGSLGTRSNFGGDPRKHCECGAQTERSCDGHVNELATAVGKRGSGPLRTLGNVTELTSGVPTRGRGKDAGARPHRLPPVTDRGLLGGVLTFQRFCPAPGWGQLWPCSQRKPHRVARSAVRSSDAEDTGGARTSAAAPQYNRKTRFGVSARGCPVLVGLSRSRGEVNSEMGVQEERGLHSPLVTAPNRQTFFL